MKRTVLLTFYIGLSGVSQSQVFTNYTTSEGLINNTVNCLAIDAANDEIWFGTQEGVSHFDGTSGWVSHEQATDSGIVSNTITAISVMTNGTVWIGTDFGASMYNGSVWTSFTEADGLGDDRVKCIHEDSNGDVWFGNNDGVSKFDGTNWISFTTSDGLPFGGIHAITELTNGNLWMGSGLGGIVIYDATDFSFITEDEGLLNDKVRAIAVDDEGRRWIGTSDGISQFNNDNQHSSNHTTIFTLPAPDTLNPIEDVKLDNSGNVWAAVYVEYLVTEGGISWWNGGAWTQYDVNDGLIGPVVRQIAITSSDDIWVATSTGVSKISNVPGLNIQNIKSEGSFSFYPNPVNDVLNIVLEEANAIQLYNTAFQVVYQYDAVQPGSLSLSTQKLKTGLYFLRVGNQMSKIQVFH